MVEVPIGQRQVVAPADGEQFPELSFAVGSDKDFIGREALLAARSAAGVPRRRLRRLTLDDPRVICLGTEPVRLDSVGYGRVTSGPSPERG